ncbi:hypothetical protein L873DRAFT_1845727 [Choiromyces venosus 120613-1]|uniref:Uncharacterized protein n=1 Tax=Choiromyces venosus 120613-1 TaxID=1336337 RepID=A0A3N4JCB9_9PEZI|nr:hypothetical protein L873DRAFT_1845727 [Choiromyces venosus 120613-1]
MILIYKNMKNPAESLPLCFLLSLSVLHPLMPAHQQSRLEYRSMGGRKRSGKYKRLLARYLQCREMGDVGWRPKDCGIHSKRIIGGPAFPNPVGFIGAWRSRSLPAYAIRASDKSREASEVEREITHDKQNIKKPSDFGRKHTCLLSPLKSSQATDIQDNYITALFDSLGEKKRARHTKYSSSIKVIVKHYSYCPPPDVPLQTLPIASRLNHHGRKRTFDKMSEASKVEK